MGLVEEARLAVSVWPHAQCDVDYGSAVERSGPVLVGNVLGLRDGLPKSKKNGKVPLLRGDFFLFSLNGDFEGSGLTPMLKQ